MSAGSIFKVPMFVGSLEPSASPMRARVNEYNHCADPLSQVLLENSTPKYYQQNLTNNCRQHYKNYLYIIIILVTYIKGHATEHAEVRRFISHFRGDNEKYYGCKE